MFFELAQLAINNLLRARARLIMTSGGVLVGTTAVILLVALTIGLQNSAEAQLGADSSLTELTIYPSWSPKPDAKIPQLTIKAIQEFAQLKGVKAVIPQFYLNSGGQLESGKYFNYAQIIGVDSRLLPYMGIVPEQGEVQLEKGSVLVGNQIANNFYDPNSETYEPIAVDMMTTDTKLYIYGNTGNQRKVKLKVAGILASNPTYDYYIIMPIQDAIDYQEWAQNATIDLKKFTYNQVVVRTTGRDTTQSVSQALRDLGYSVSGLGDYLNSINSFFSTLRLMLGGVGGVALLVAAFGVANTMTMAILERTREIGLMKAIGATDSNVLTIFLVEAGLVGFLGGIAGVGTSLLLQNLINEAVRTSQPTDPSAGGVGTFLPVDLSNLQGGLVVIPTELMLFALLLATGVGIVAGLYPSLRAARMTTVVALKTD